MFCPTCNVNSPQPHGYFGKNRTPRFRCRQCRRTFSERSVKPCQALNLPDATLYRILDCLAEGCSVRTTARLCDVHVATVLKVLNIAGEKCEKIMLEHFREVPVKEVQVDELWGYTYCKERNKRDPNNERQGDSWTFLAVERYSKAILCWHLGRRTAQDTEVFIEKLNEATSGRFQLTSDGMRSYPQAVSLSLGTRVDYSQLIKVYSGMTDGPTRYSPARLEGTIKEPWFGTPDLDFVCTSHVERVNLTVRMRLRRLTRLTNAFSRKWTNLRSAVALFVFDYNFRQLHRSIHCTPAMAAGVASTIWTWKDLFNTI